MTDAHEENWYSDDAATFGDRLVGARDASGMSQKSLAKRLGVKLKTIQSWENDLSEPRANRLQMVAGILNVSLMWLLTGEGEGINAPDSEEISPDVKDLLVEIRDLKAGLKRSADRLGRLEKALRLRCQQVGGL